jgi:hypothetical protein
MTFPGGKNLAVLPVGTVLRMQGVCPEGWVKIDGQESTTAQFLTSVPLYELSLYNADKNNMFDAPALVPFPDGSAFYPAGGIPNFAKINPLTGTASATASPHANFTNVLQMMIGKVGDYQAYIYDDGYCQIYNIRTNTWGPIHTIVPGGVYSSTSTPGFSTRLSPAVIDLGNGDALLLRASTSTNVDRWNGATQTWTGVVTVPNLTNSIDGGVLLSNGSVYIIGLDGKGVVFNPYTNAASALDTVICSYAGINSGCQGDARIFATPNDQVVYLQNNSTNGTANCQVREAGGTWTANTARSSSGSGPSAYPLGGCAIVGNLPNGDVFFSAGCANANAFGTCSGIWSITTKTATFSGPGTYSNNLVMLDQYTVLAVAYPNATAWNALTNTNKNIPLGTSGSYRHLFKLDDSSFARFSYVDTSTTPMVQLYNWITGFVSTIGNKTSNFGSIASYGIDGRQRKFANCGVTWNNNSGLSYWMPEQSIKALKDGLCFFARKIS